MKHTKLFFAMLLVGSVGLKAMDNSLSSAAVSSSSSGGAVEVLRKEAGSPSPMASEVLPAPTPTNSSASEELRAQHAISSGPASAVAAIATAAERTGSSSPRRHSGELGERRASGDVDAPPAGTVPAAKSGGWFSCAQQ